MSLASDRFFLKTFLILALAGLCLEWHAGRVSAQNTAVAPEELFRGAVRPAVTYEGVAVVVTHNDGGKSVSRVRIYSTADGLIRREYTENEGKRRDVFIQTKGWFIYWRADAKQITVRKYPVDIPPESFGNADLILANYEVRAEGEETQAGRNAIKLRLRSKYGSRPDVRLWVDAANRMILREVRCDLAGKDAVERGFEEVRFPAALDAGLFEPPAGAAVEDMTNVINKPRPKSGRTAQEELDEVSRTMNGRLRTPTHLPEGFQLVSARAQLFSKGDSPAYTLHLGYSDGLTAMSVFIQETGKDGEFAGEFKRTENMMRNEKGEEVKPKMIEFAGMEVSDYSRGSQTILRREEKGLCVTVIGEIERKGLLETLAGVKAQTKTD